MKSARATEKANDLEAPLLPNQGRHVESQNQEAMTKNAQAAASARFVAFDVFRGLIMVVMAWDHSKDIVADTTQKGREGWQGEAANFNNSFGFFAARAISDICAPGFFFTMGFGMVFFTISRLKKGWTFWDVQRHYLSRSFVLFLVEKYVNICFNIPRTLPIAFGKGYDNPVTNSTGVDPKTIIQSLVFGVFEVMTALSLVMAITSLFLLFPLIKWNDYRSTESSKPEGERKWIYKFVPCSQAIGWIIAGLCFITSNTIITHYQHDHPSIIDHLDEFPNNSAAANTFWQILVRLFMIPGAAAKNAYIAYPVVPWLAFTTVGMSFAFSVVNNTKVLGAEEAKKKLHKMLSLLSAVFLVMFVIVRLFFGKYGNLRGWPRGDGGKHDGEHLHVQFAIEFLYTCKYPPSLAYALITMGVNFGLLRLLCSFTDYVVALNAKLPVESEEGIKRFSIAGITYDILLVFGRVPLFFYVMHFTLLASTVALVELILWDSFPNFKHLTLTLLVWIPLLSVLWPLCVKYEKFKNTKPLNSVWRML